MPGPVPGPFRGVLLYMHNDLAPRKINLGKLESSRWEVEAGGLRNLPWKPDAENPLAPPVVDMNWLVAQPLLPVLVQVIPAHTLYRSLLAHGLGDSVEILEWVRGEQLAKVLDFDLWTESAEHGVPDIQPHRVLEWMQAWMEISPEFAATRLMEIEEEALVSIITSLFEILPEGIAATAENITDDYFPTPDRKFHLKLRVTGEEPFEIVAQVVQAMYAKNVRLASQVFAYSAMLVRQESLEDALRWRRSRLSDQGFVDSDEARTMLRPRPAATLHEDIRVHVRRMRSAAITEEERRKKFAKTHVVFMADIEPEIFDATVDLFRNIDPEEGYRYVTALIPESEIRLLTGTSSPSADRAMEDDDLLEELTERAILASRALISRSFASNLPTDDEVAAGMRTARGESDGHARNRTSETLLVERGIAALAEEQQDTILDLKSRIARVSNTLAAAVSPGDFLTGETFDRALGVTRGCINVGLELALASPKQFGLDEEVGFDEVRAGVALTQVGPEFLFQLGWQRLLVASSAVASALADLERTHPERFGFLDTERTVTLDDGKELRLSLENLLDAGRLIDVRKWVDGVEEALPAPAFWVVSALLNRVPLFPEAFETSHRTLRPFAHLSEFVVVEKFLAQLESNLSP